jgi:uncharacterized protein (DUF1015 family)
MAMIKPFPALRPQPDLASQICELPYDVMSSAEARQIAADNPLSFLHVSKPEIDLPPTTDSYDPIVYAKGQENFTKLISCGTLTQDKQPYFYLYRQVMGSHSQIGFVAVASCEDYLRNTIKKHELTRPDKEEDRMRHIEVLNSQTGPVFLTYSATDAIDAVIARETLKAPVIDFTAKDGVRHISWVVDNAADIRWIGSSPHPASYVPTVTIAAAAPGLEPSAREKAYFLAVIFPQSDANSSLQSGPQRSERFDTSGSLRKARRRFHRQTDGSGKAGAQARDRFLSGRSMVHARILPAIRLCQRSD